MGKEIDRFIEIVARLRAPGGCPWDREQTHASLLSCLLDEAYEFFDAVEERSDRNIKEELGDLLLQIVMHAHMAGERGAFDIEDVARAISEKIIRRHPHVFGDATVGSSAEVLCKWEEIKRREKADTRPYLIDGIPRNLPSLFRAEKVQRRVARVGFDWDKIDPVLDKVEEEFGEFRMALESGEQVHAAEELGDILFALVNLARHKGICAEEALRHTVEKFIRRFRYIEQHYEKTGENLKDASLEEMDRVWEESKGKVG